MDCNDVHIGVNNKKVDKLVLPMDHAGSRILLPQLQQHQAYTGAFVVFCLIDIEIERVCTHLAVKPFTHQS